MMTVLILIFKLFIFDPIPNFCVRRNLLVCHLRCCVGAFDIFFILFLSARGESFVCCSCRVSCDVLFELFFYLLYFTRCFCVHLLIAQDLYFVRIPDPCVAMMLGGIFV